ncbi:peptidase S8/S53 domain-containing protein [Chytridium lagenaria]|nr:peptidase S8/S53 domain-containing protein [Chytridium lagenaria]
MHLLSSLLCLATALAAVSAQHIPNEYIVVYKSEATEITTATHEAWLLAHATNVNGSPLNDESFKGYPDLPSFPGFRFLQKYSDTGVRGYSAALTSDMAEKISQLPEVAYVERNQIYKAAAALNSYGSTWGLQRISKESLPLPNVFTYPAEAGENSVVYVLDTGIRASHKEFSGRASYGKNFLAPEESGLDQHGHGTHCAGIIAGTTYGVAKKASIVSVKVLDKTGSGRTDVLVSAIQWVKAASLASNKPCIVNIAFTGGASQFLDEAIKDITINGNCLVVASAGNQGRDACRSSPGRLDSTLTVGATQDTDAFLSTSNWGACVKINAPGYYSLSSWSSSNEAKHAASGTSVASSHVAGVAAVAYSQFNFATPFEAMKYIIDKSATSKITGLTGVKSITPNRLLQLPANPSSPSQSLSPGPTSSSTLSPDPTTAQPPITVSSASSTTSAVPTIAPVVPKTGYCVNNNPVRMGYITAWFVSN